MRTSWPRLTLIVPASLFAALILAGCNDATPPAPTPAASVAAPAAPASTPAAPAAANEPKNYQAAQYDPMHFKPAIYKATDQQCLACHAEVLVPSVRKTSLAGLESANVKAWYQQLNTYQGDQDTFHRRHLVTAYAKQVMNLHCNTCHTGSDPRDQNPGSSATAQPDLTLRKTVVPEETCLKCHGQHNWPVMGLPGPWSQFRDTFQNNCVTACHSFQRTVRHQVNYLNAKAIEELGAKPNGGDVCLGCHGGRPWYRIVYPYPRHAWPNMPTDTPAWAKGRPTESEPRFRIAIAAAASAAPAAAETPPASDASAASAQGEKK